MTELMWATFGCALGGMARYACSGWVARRFGERFPWGTLVVNVVGSFIIGCVAAHAGTGGWLADPTARTFLMTGICGGYTTFSSVSLQTLSLARDGEWLRVTVNIVLSVVLCFAAVVLGHWVVLGVATGGGG